MKVDNSVQWKYQDPNTIDFKPLNVAVIGGTGGIGRAISRLLALSGANVFVVGQTFRDSDVKGINFIKGDLSSIAEAKRIAKELPQDKLDIAIFTAGIFASSKREETGEGLERDMAVSYLNRLAMIRTIAPTFEKSKSELGFNKRIFIMGFPGNDQLGTIDNLNQEKSYGTMQAHMNTVAGNEALVVDLAERYKYVGFYGLNPGLIRTNIRSNLFGNGILHTVAESLIGWFNQSADDYAKKIVPLFVSPDIENHSGAMFNNKGQAVLGSKGFTKEYAKDFIAKSEVLLKSKGLDTES
ncbi:uncharacterized protein AC631_03748 [Debaryomyces fabryi]|uniref:Oxidoreductase n=1 Tax=Debaryomyces fabryi TaxID=58627 RepID=A0A0V1PW50_9ASCO|nr:uncharacterized protein AC631_03748 [Debaryomyces fabryi]KSA00471.1 hypothetical protein AC631_03748 [Debaryomyces fabryi]